MECARPISPVHTLEALSGSSSPPCQLASGNMGFVSSLSNKHIGGECGASFVPSAIRIFALSHEEESQAPAEQVRNECQNQIMDIPSETSLRFKSSNSYHANNTYLASFQTQSETSPELLTLVRKISKKERPKGKQHQQFVFRYGKHSVSEKQPHRPSQFKLAYVENTRKKDKLGFGPKSCKKVQKLL